MCIRDRSRWPADIHSFYCHPLDSKSWLPAQAGPVYNVHGSVTYFRRVPNRRANPRHLTPLHGRARRRNRLAYLRADLAPRPSLRASSCAAAAATAAAHLTPLRRFTCWLRCFSGEWRIVSVDQSRAALGRCWAPWRAPRRGRCQASDAAALHVIKKKNCLSAAESTFLRNVKLVFTYE